MPALLATLRPLPLSSQPPKPLIPFSFGMRVIWRPGSSHCPKLLCESRISLRSNESQWHRFSRSPGLCHLSQAHKKLPAGCRFYMHDIVLFSLAEQLLLTAFSLQTCLTTLPQQTVERLNCNQSNFINMTSLGSPQHIFSPPPHLFGFTHSADTCQTNDTVIYSQ